MSSGTKREQRTLAELVQHERLYADIHAYFTWVLRGCYSRLFERQLEGPSLVALPAPRQDILGWDNLGRPGTFAALAQVLNTLGHEAFASVATAVSMGDQCVVRCAYPEVAASVASVLAQLVPGRCAVVELCPPAYMPPQLCNFLVLADTAVLVPGEEKALQVQQRGAAPAAADARDVVDHVAAAAEARAAAALAKAAELAASEGSEDDADDARNGATAPGADERPGGAAAEAPPARGSAGKVDAMDRIVLLDIHVAETHKQATAAAADASSGAQTSAPTADGDTAETASRPGSPASSADPLNMSFTPGEDVEAASRPPPGVSISVQVIGGPQHAPNSYARTIAGFLMRTHNELVQDHLLLTLRERWMHMTKAYFRYRRTLAHADELKADQSFAQGFGIELDDLAVLRFWAQGLSRAHRIKLLQRPRAADLDQ